jgi:hypothetical protein
MDNDMTPENIDNEHSTHAEIQDAGAIAQGEGTTAAGEGGVAVGEDVGGDVRIG